MNETDVQVFETEVVLFPMNTTRVNDVILVERKDEETAADFNELKDRENILKAKFARFRKGMRKRASGIL